MRNSTRRSLHLTIFISQAVDGPLGTSPFHLKSVVQCRWFSVKSIRFLTAQKESAVVGCGCVQFLPLNGLAQDEYCRWGWTATVCNIYSYRCLSITRSSLRRSACSFLKKRLIFLLQDRSYHIVTLGKELLCRRSCAYKFLSFSVQVFSVRIALVIIHMPRPIRRIGSSTDNRRLTAS